MSNPFTPGYDRIPPVFAGREWEMDVMEKLARDLSSGQPGGPDVVLYGPRGNGKTTLLNYAHERLQVTSNVRSITLDPSDVPTPNEVYEVLLEKPSHTGETVTTQGEVKAGILGTGASARRSTARVFEPTLTDTKKRCIELMVETPTLLLIDEAHEISKESLRVVASLARASNRGETNFRFVLAGTPSLPTHLREIGPTYLNRAHRIRMERLDVESTESALFEPMENEGYRIQLSGEERTRLIERTQCYPHFIQSIGHAIWDVVETADRNDVETEIVEKARPIWETWIDAMYNDRVGELKRQQLVPYAQALAAAFDGSRDVLGFEDIEKVVVDCNANANALEVIQEFEALGYIWETAKDAMQYEPGIPSLMDHILGTVKHREA